MRIESLSPMLARTLIAALPKVARVFPSAQQPQSSSAQQQPPPQSVAAQPMPSVAMLVTLAASDPAVERRRRLADSADRGLDALDRLHAELVAGKASPQRLREIADWSKSFELPDNPVLASILSEIDLRVRVELAKIDIRA